MFSNVRSTNINYKTRRLNKLLTSSFNCKMKFGNVHFYNNSTSNIIYFSVFRNIL